MSNPIPNELSDLLTGPVVVTLATVMPDGQPQATPIWCSFDGDVIWFNTAVGRQKDKNLQADPKVTILSVDPQNPYRWLEVRGQVVERTLEGAVDHITELAKLYTGKDRYYGGVTPAEQQAKETRVIYKIKPHKVTHS
jgi:PPOX class probable F420-dependent enzyme